MAIRLNIKAKQRQMVKALGAELYQDGKTWVIPNSIMDINPFKDWLPEEEGHIVQRPYFVVRTKGACRKCGKETPLIALGAKTYQSRSPILFYNRYTLYLPIAAEFYNHLSVQEAKLLIDQLIASHLPLTKKAP